MKTIFKRDMKRKKAEDEDNLKNAELCWICKQRFLVKNQNFCQYLKKNRTKQGKKNPDRMRKWKVRDNCLMTDEDRRAALVIRNLNRGKSFAIICQMPSKPYPYMMNVCVFTDLIYETIKND